MAVNQGPRTRSDESVKPISGREELEAYARSIGADVFGVAAAEAFSEFRSKPQPDRFVPDAKSVIIVGVANTPGLFESVLKPELAEITPDGSDFAGRADKYMDRPPTGAERYFLNDEAAVTTNEVMLLGYKISWKLRKEGYEAFYFSPFQQDARFRTAAFYFTPAMYLAGMGQMGYNCAILTPEYGPRIWVTAIITDKEIEAGQPVGPRYYEGCKTCLECVRQCPSRALDGKGWKNAWRCGSYGCCGTCLSVCPVGRPEPVQSGEPTA